MIEGVESLTNHEVNHKPKTNNWTGICQVCGKQTHSVEVKHLITDLYTIDMIYTDCGHHFLGDEEVL